MDPSWASQEVQPVVYQFSLTNLTNIVEALATLSNWVNILIPQLKLSPRGAFQLELVLVEAVTNIVENAYENAADHEITITLHCQEHTVRVTIKDDGQPFDPFQVPAIELPDSLEDAKEGGLGIHLIRSYTKECHYCREGQYNLLVLVLDVFEELTAFE